MKKFSQQVKASLGNSNRTISETLKRFSQQMLIVAERQAHVESTVEAVSQQAEAVNSHLL